MIYFTHNPEKTEKIIVFFESIRYLSLPLLFWYLWLQYPVYYMEVNPEIQNFTFFKNRKQKGIIKRIDLNDIDIKTQFADHNVALNCIEEIFNSNFGKNLQISIIQKLLDSDLVQGCYKKIILQEIFAYYQILTIIEHLANNSKDRSSIIFIPGASFFFVKILKRDNKDVVSEKKFSVSVYGRIILHFSLLFGKVRSVLLIGGFPAWLFLKIIQKPKVQPDLKKYKVGIRIYTNDVSFYYKYRSIDFLLDGTIINSKNTLFCIETPISKEYEQKLNEKKYNYIHFSELLYHTNADFIKREIFGKLFVCWLKLVILSPFQVTPFNKITLDILNKYIHWQRFMDIYTIDNYVVYNDLEIDSIVRNILFHKNKIKTNYYIHSCNNPDLYTPPGYDDFRSVFFVSYLNYQYFITWGRKTEKTLSAYPPHNQKFNSVGCIWSQIVRDIENSGLAELIKNEIINKMESEGKSWQNIIIGVFDTTFGNETPLTSGDITAFLDGIFNLLNDNPNITILFKPKRNLDDHFILYPDVIGRYQRLRKHPRCCILEPVFDVSEVIALSDLVISACFTSITIEALGACKKAFFYDATGRFCDYYYDKFPHMVAHNYKDLKEFVQYWLRIEKDAFDEYLYVYIRNEIDAFIDGRGLTRFREHLLAD